MTKACGHGDYYYYLGRSSECYWNMWLRAAALLERQQLWHCAKRYAWSLLTGVGCIANTHPPLHKTQSISNRKLQRTSSWACANWVWLHWLTWKNLISLYLHSCLLDDNETLWGTVSIVSNVHLQTPLHKGFQGVWWCTPPAPISNTLTMYL